MTLQTDLFPVDTCEGFHKGNPESRAAFDALLPHLGRLQERVLDYARICADQGWPLLTVKAVRRGLMMEHQTAGARLSELKRMELIVPTEQRHEGCRVVEITELGRRTLKEWQKQNK
jgi:hypothetical protein